MGRDLATERLSVRVAGRGLARRLKLAALSTRRRMERATTRGLGAGEFWRRTYSRTWDARMARSLVEREGHITGPQALYVAHPFRLEEYGALDALVGWILERQGEVRIADIACGSGLACFFVAANRERYGGRVTYVGVDSSEEQLFVARLRNPWSFATFRSGNLYATGLKTGSFDLVLNWQVVNHVGRIDEALVELARISRGAIYMIAYAFLEAGEFARRFGGGHEAEWADLAWAFDREHVRRTISSLGVDQLWRPVRAGSFIRSLPEGSTAEHILMQRPDLGIRSWEDLRSDDAWKERITRL